MMIARALVAVGLVGLLACAPGAKVSAPAVVEADTAALAERVVAATAQRDAVLAAVAREDAPRKGNEKTLPVEKQLAAARAKVEAPPARPYREADVRAYEAAVSELESAYLSSLLESTDPSSKSGPWTADEGRDVLGSATVDARLAAWQAFDSKRPFAKYAVVRDEAGQLAMRVGRLDVAHVDIAGGHALTAGLLRTTTENGRTVVIVLENTSGGFRPGPLRNRTTLAALEAAHYLPADRAALTVHDNPSGSYDDSVLIPAKKP